MKNENLHNLYGLSRELNLPVKWLKAKAVKGQIPCLKIGRRFRFNIKAVETALLEMAEKGGNNDC
ncbi:MAG: hypothetical protein ISS76_22085 [Phycisphaerae bacterium]|nr:hypothetical protein [Phycisphaerae bacterium]